MTQPTHTPAPWFQYRNYVTDKQSFALEDNGIRVGETPNFIIDAETEANARLIAAAPELLEALEKITKRFPSEDRLLKTNMPDGSIMIFEVEIQDIINAYRQIAKAKGQS